MKNGGVTVTLATAISTGLMVVGWVSQYYVQQIAQAQVISDTNTRITILCNDYLNTISRIDQNMQNMATALHVNVVRGEYNSSLCSK
jgi:hypothetical protein